MGRTGQAQGGPEDPSTSEEFQYRMPGILRRPRPRPQAPRAASLRRSTPRSRSLPHSRAASSSSRRASAVRPRRVEQLAAHARQQVRVRQRAGRDQLVDDRQGRRRPLGHRHRDRPVELDHRRGREPAERLVEQHDPVPVRLVDRRRDRVALGDRGLQAVGARGRGRPARPGQRGAAAADRRPVPAPPVLVLEQHRLAVGAGAGGEPRGGQLEQRQQAVDLGLVGHQPGQRRGPAAAPRARGRAGSARRRSVAVEPSVKIR